MMCISTPIVASSTPPVLDYLDKSSSILVDYPSAESLVTGISKCLDLSDSKISAFARRNLRTIKNKADLANYSLKEQIRQIKYLLARSK